MMVDLGLREENLLVVVEIKGLSIPYQFSIRFQEKLYYFYPKNYIDYLKIFDKLLDDLNTPSFSPNRSLTSENELKFKTGLSSVSYIIFKKTNNFPNDQEDWMNAVWNEVRIIQNILSAIFNFVIILSKSYIFNVNSSIFKLIRVGILKEKFVNGGGNPFNYEIDNFPNIFQTFLNNINTPFKKSFVKDLIWELIIGKTANDIQPKTTGLWNFLEHAAKIFAALQNHNVVIDESKYSALLENIQEKLSEILNSPGISPYVDVEGLKSEINRSVNLKLNQSVERMQVRKIKSIIRNTITNTIETSNIFIDGFDNNRIKGLILSKINNFPPIKTLIEIMVGSLWNDEAKRIIDYMYEARNYFYHSGSNIEGLIEVLNSEENHEQITFNDFRNALKDFESFLDSYIFTLFSIDIPRNRSSFSWHTVNPPADLNEARIWFKTIITEKKQNYQGDTKYKNILRYIYINESNWTNGLFEDNFGSIAFQGEGNEHDLIECKIKINNLFSWNILSFNTVTFSEPSHHFLIYIENPHMNCILASRGNLEMVSLKQFVYNTNFVEFIINASESFVNYDLPNQLVTKNWDPLAKNFWNNNLIQNYFSLPEEFNIPNQEDGNEILRIDPIIILSHENLMEFPRFRNILGFKNVNFKKIDEGHIQINYSSSIFRNNNDIQLFKPQRVNINIESEYCVFFEFLDCKGAIFITNSPSLVNIKIELIKQRRKWDHGNYLGIHGGLLTKFIEFLADISKKYKISREIIEQYNPENILLNASIRVNISERGDILKILESRDKIFSLLGKIAIYPNFNQVRSGISLEMRDFRETTIDPFLDTDFQGLHWFSYALCLILYHFSSENDIPSNFHQSESFINLLEICNNIRANRLNKDNVKSLLNFLYALILDYCF